MVSPWFHRFSLSSRSSSISRSILFFFGCIGSDMASLYETLASDSVLEMDQAVLDTMHAKIEEELKKLDEKWVSLLCLVVDKGSYWEEKGLNVWGFFVRKDNLWENSLRNWSYGIRNVIIIINWEIWSQAPVIPFYNFRTNVNFITRERQIIQLNGFRIGGCRNWI